jgi:S1-C subfamily serine protease
MTESMNDPRRGISFAIPIDYAKEFLAKSEQARKSGWPTATGKRRYKQQPDGAYCTGIVPVDRINA